MSLSPPHHDGGVGKHGSATEATTVRRRRTDDKLASTSEEAGDQGGGAAGCHGSMWATWWRHWRIYDGGWWIYADRGSRHGYRSLDHLQRMPSIQTGEAGFEATLECRGCVLLLPGAQGKIDVLGVHFSIDLDPWLLIRFWCRAEQW